MKGGVRGRYAVVILLLTMGGGGCACGSSAKRDPDAGDSDSAPPDAGLDVAALHIGQACQVPPNVAEAGVPSAIILIGLECPSRICVLPARETASDTTSLCAAECSSD